MGVAGEGVVMELDDEGEYKEVLRPRGCLACFCVSLAATGVV